MVYVELSLVHRLSNTVLYHCRMRKLSLFEVSFIKQSFNGEFPHYAVIGLSHKYTHTHTLMYIFNLSVHFQFCGCPFRKQGTSNCNHFRQSSMYNFHQSIIIQLNAERSDGIVCCACVYHSFHYDIRAKSTNTFFTSESLLILLRISRCTN